MSESRRQNVQRAINSSSDDKTQTQLVVGTD